MGNPFSLVSVGYFCTRRNMRELFDTLCEYAVQLVDIPAHNSSRQQRRPWTLHSWWSVCIEHVNLRKVTCWRRGSVVRMSIFSWRTFPDLRLIYG